MNHTQRNFKKQMKNVEYKAHKKRGIFSNKLFNLRFFGNNYSYQHDCLLIKLIKIIFNIILFVIRIALSLFLILLIYTVIKNIPH